METISNITLETAQQILAADLLAKALARQVVLETVPEYDDDEYQLLVEL
jgi:hypothetical protein